MTGCCQRTAPAHLPYRDGSFIYKKIPIAEALYNKQLIVGCGGYQ